MSTANGTAHGYVIQGRSNTDIPIVLIDGPLPLVLTKERWTTIPTARVIAGFGVANPIWNKIAEENGLLAYTTAIGLMAKLASELPFGGPEFRLLERKLTYSWTIEDVGTTEPFTFMDRQRCEKITPVSGVSLKREEDKK